MRSFPVWLLVVLVVLVGAVSCGGFEAGQRAAGPDERSEPSGGSEKLERSDAPSNEQRPETTQAAPRTELEDTGTDETSLGEETQAVGEPERLFEEEGGFSFVPPEGWEVVEIPGLKYRAAAGPPSGGFAPNINVVDEKFGGSLEEYADANIATMEQIFEDFRLLSEEDFETDEGERAVRIATEGIQQGSLLRQTYYLFDAGSTKLVVTCSRLADAQEEADTACDERMETFQVD